MRNESSDIQIKKSEMVFDIKSCVFQVDNDPKGNIVKINKPGN